MCFTFFQILLFFSFCQAGFLGTSTGNLEELWLGLASSGRQALVIWRNCGLAWPGLSNSGGSPLSWAGLILRQSTFFLKSTFFLNLTGPAWADSEAGPLFFLRSTFFSQSGRPDFRTKSTFFLKSFTFFLNPLFFLKYFFS